MNYKLDRLLAGETFVTKESGNSMTPRIKHRQPHKLAPVTSLDEIQVDDIVYCKVKGNYLTHLVKAKSEEKGLLIGNMHGKINGWTKKVYGRVIEILPQE